MLIQIGINSSRIVVKSNIEDITFSSDNSYSNAIAFEFKPLDKKRIASIAPKAIKIPKSITFYPTFSKTNILKTKKIYVLLTLEKKPLLVGESSGYPNILMKSL